MPPVLDAEPFALPPSTHPELRTIKIGIAGLGQVGQAVARLVPEATRLKHAGYRFRIAGALVREIDKPRRCARPPRITTNPSAFLRGNYDVVIEALAAVEPARSIVSRLLGRGIPVVTANKALVAAHGAELTALAARRGTTLRYEASALAGVPFLGAFAARPLVSDVQQLTAVVNGTSNFVVSKLEEGACTFEQAVEQAQALGLTEPDASRDLDGLDAADKLTLLSSLFGWGTLSPFRLEIQGIRGLTARDLEIAQSLNATIKPVVFASRTAAGVSAFVGPALVPRSHPLASLGGSLSGIQLKGRFVSDLYFSGLGAGPEITAATVVDDAVEAVSTRLSRPTRAAAGVPRVATVASPPLSKWLVRTSFPGVVPDAASVAQVFLSHNVATSHVTEAYDACRWVQTTPIASDALSSALSRLAGTHRLQTSAIRIL
jgi:homoserine dehydrogenase